MSVPSRSTSLRRPGFLALVLAVVLAPLALLAAPAHAVPSTTIVISEIYATQGSSNLYNQDFIELYNPTGSAVNVNGWSVQYRAATSSTGASSKADLTGWIPAGGYYLVGGASATCTPGPCTNAIPTPDVTSGIDMAGSASGGGVVILSNQGTLLPNAQIGATSNIDYTKIVDLVGYGSANVYENAATTSSLTATRPLAANSIRRTTADADDNSAEFTTAGSGVADPHNCDCVAPSALKITEVYTEGGTDAAGYDHDFVELQNTGSSTLPMASLSLQYRSPDGTVTKLKDLAGSMAAGSYDVLQLGASGAAGQAVPFDPGYDLSATAPDLDKAGGTLYVAKSATDYDTGAGAIDYDTATAQYVSDLVGWGDASAYEGTAADSADLTATTSLARAAGGVDANDNSADLSTSSLSPDASTVVPIKTIPEIQGTGTTTPLNGATVQTSGVITAAYGSGTGNFSGFYLQTAAYDPANDATPGASDGIFVYTGSLPMQTVGKYVFIKSAKVSEFRGMTELTVTSAANIDARDALPGEKVIPAPVVPGTDCEITESSTDCLTGAALEAAREAHEGELYLPTAPYTVSDSYDGSPWTQSTSEGFQMKGEIGLAANSTNPLMIPTELANPTTEPALHAAIGKYNAAHMITLDDGANVDYSSTTGTPFPWLTGPSHTVRIGAPVTFAQPVVLDYRNDLWKLQPQTKVEGGTDGTAQGITIAQNRPEEPDTVGGNVRIATFNMLNYFVDDAATWEANGGDDYPGVDRDCSYYHDRSTTSTTNGSLPGQVTANTCTWTDARGVVPPAVPVEDGAPGPRGAAQKCDCTDLTNDFADFERQQAKEIRAINTMNADVMSLEEVENAIKLGYTDRDRAVTHLVDVLNADWSTNHPEEDNDMQPRWAYAPSPRLEAQPTIAEQDAIRSAFIYNPRVVETVGRSEILVNSAPFRNAREPLAQAFKRVGGNRDDGFIVIVNHFKSKGGPTDISTVLGTDNDDKGDGAGYYNGDRVRQAKALDAFAQSVSEDKGIPAVFMTGDYNAYSNEDPVLTLETSENGGWHELAPDNHQKSYSFGGLMGSLDHVFANDAALGMVTGQTVWPINANEPVFYEYSRYNYNVTNLYDGATPYRASDHNPEIIGVNAPVTGTPPAVDTVQVLASNDFHGRILDDPASAAAGAASMAEAVKGLRSENENTLFAMAGDIIGGSTFESFIAEDQPTIDAMNEAGLDVSAAGNHEFDKGYHDLRDRVMSDDGADWPYLAANVRLSADDSYALAPEHTARSYQNSNGATWWKQLPDGHSVGFVGAVTEDLPSLVAPSALADVYLTHIADEVNASAEDLKTDGCGGAPCDLVVMLVHEGAPAPDCSTVLDTGNRFGQLVAAIDPTVDAIVSGHTHLKYNCKQDVAAWSTRAVTERPVVSAGQYGSYLNQLEFDFEPGTDNLLDIRQHVLAMKDYDADPDTQDIVDDAVDNANVQGQVSIGTETAPFQRARRQDPTTSTVVENRGGESTLGNLVAEIQRWKTGAEIGFMNPGGLRADLMGAGSYPSSITYRQAADVQPFANTLMTADLTGDQIKTVLEQQWQRDPDGNIPSRPFLRLGTSKGFQFSYDPSRPEGDRITGMWLDGEALDPAGTYQVSATNFLFEGGDNFRGLIDGTHKQDTGFSDLQATVDYLEAHPTVSPDFAQHAVNVKLAGSTPDGGYAEGDTVTLDVASLAMTGDQVQEDAQDTTVRVYDGATAIGPPASVDNTLRSLPDDEAGTAHVTFRVPAGVTGPTTTFLLKGDETGTAFPITVPTRDNRTTTTVSADDVGVTYGKAKDIAITVAPSGATGTVTVKDGTTVLGTADVTDGAATYTLAAGSFEPGHHTVTLSYGGDETYAPSTGTLDVSVEKATPTIDAAASPAAVEAGETSSIQVQVSADGFTPTGTVTCSASGMEDVVETLVSGEATCEVGPWNTTGARTVTVTYSGDSHATSRSTTEDVSVDQAESTVSALANPTTVTQGTGTSQVTVTVSSAGATPTGTVTCDTGTPVALAGGSATCTVGPFATTGVKTVSIAYSGDANTTSGSTTVAINVTAPGGGGDETPVSTTVSGSASAIAWGEAGVVHVTVSSTKATTGTVTVKDGGTTLGSASIASNGTADVVIPAKALPVGSHSLAVTYSGDSANKPSSGSVSVPVVKAASTTTVAVSPAEVTVHGGTATVTAHVSSPAGTPGGSVAFSVDGIDVGTVPVGADGTASTQVGPFDTVRAHDVTARYTGDDNTKGSDASGVVTVVKAKPKLTVDRRPGHVVRKKTHVVLVVQLTVPGQVVAGDVKMLGAPGGPVTGTLKDGSVRFRLPVFKKAGKVKLKVNYLGSDDDERVSKTVPFRVFKHR